MTEASSPAGDGALLQLNGITRSYQLGRDRQVSVLKGIDLSVHAGEFVALMGPSGSGKSTLLHIIGCLDQPDGGQYSLAGERVDQLRDHQLADLRSRRIGFVFQAFHLVPQLTIDANVAMPLFYQRVNRREQRRRAAAALTRVGLGHRLGHRPSQLSGGEQQRAAIARALVSEPDLLMADEPTGALDSKTGTEVMALLEELHQDGLTIVMVTHDPDVAAQADRLVHMRDGVLVDDVVAAGPA